MSGFWYTKWPGHVRSGWPCHEIGLELLQQQLLTVQGHRWHVPLIRIVGKDRIRFGHQQSLAVEKSGETSETRGPWMVWSRPIVAICLGFHLRIPSLFSLKQPPVSMVHLLVSTKPWFFQGVPEGLSCGMGWLSWWRRQYRRGYDYDGDDDDDDGGGGGGGDGDGDVMLQESREIQLTPKSDCPGGGAWLCCGWIGMPCKLLPRYIFCHRDTC